MKKIIILIVFVFVLALCNFTFAQSPLAEFDKAKEIKLLKFSREDVRKILADYKLERSYDSENYESFYTNNAGINVHYSKGKCSDGSADWNVPEWTVEDIEITPKDSIKIKDIGFDNVKFRKERAYKNVADAYVYHNKGLGIAFDIRENEIQRIYLFPTKQEFSLLCNNEKVRKYYSSKTWFVDSKLKDRIIDYNFFADVVNLILGASEISETCPLPNLTKTESCPASVNAITILTVAKDPENDVLTYDYKVSGGKIIGQGANVIWDLSGVKPGTYTITAAVNDSCGLCGKSITKTVVVKECPNCHIK